MQGENASPLTTAGPSAAYQWRSCLTRMEGAYAANTIRSYRVDFTIFEAWCAENERTALPASPETVAEFVHAQSKSAAPATVSRRRASIAKIHRLLKLENPVSSEEVNLATRTVFRQKGRRQEQALGLTSALKQQIIGACANDLRGLRDRALFAVGYDTLCRRAELVQLRIDDLTSKRDGSATILVRKSKADQFGHGRLAYLSIEAFAHLQTWISAAAITTGPIFRGTCGPVLMPEALHPYSVARVLKDAARTAGLPKDEIAKLSGHSMRVGAAQDMAAAGIDLGAIMHAGGWKSPDMVMRYIEHMEVGKSGMARLYRAAIKDPAEVLLHRIGAKG
ncbi:MAG: site-specific integrase [Pseudolabrys sp.]|nr:site-specific integrase [Pseudolabrys sp.]MDP2296031.1 site-specific integrase [Pseudolabrys sp.]